MKLFELKPAEGSTKAVYRKGRGIASEYAAVNVARLNDLEAGAIVAAAALIEAGIIKKTLDGVKILGNGEITKALTVRAAKFSKSAKEKIEAAGGKTEVVA